jgi:hypothetical protein
VCWEDGRRRSFEGLGFLTFNDDAVETAWTTVLHSPAHGMPNSMISVDTHPTRRHHTPHAFSLSFALIPPK